MVQLYHSTVRDIVVEHCKLCVRFFGMLMVYCEVKKKTGQHSRVKSGLQDELYQITVRTLK